MDIKHSDKISIPFQCGIIIETLTLYSVRPNYYFIRRSEPLPIFSSKNTSAPRFNKVLIVSIWIGDLKSVPTEDFKAEIIKVCV